MKVHPLVLCYTITTGVAVAQLACTWDDTGRVLKVASEGIALLACFVMGRIGGVHSVVACYKKYFPEVEGD